MIGQQFVIEIHETKPQTIIQYYGMLKSEIIFEHLYWIFAIHNFQNSLHSVCCTDHLKYGRWMCYISQNYIYSIFLIKNSCKDGLILITIYLDLTKLNIRWLICRKSIMKLKKETNVRHFMRILWNLHDKNYDIVLK